MRLLIIAILLMSVTANASSMYETLEECIEDQTSVITENLDCHTLESNLKSYSEVLNFCNREVRQ